MVTTFSTFIDISGRVTFEEGFRHATKPADLKLRAQQLGLLGT
jgi:hypothetical protein